jgi:peptidoglycan hydrolase-like protein with peptidoglycan-binding domain
LNPSLSDTQRQMAQQALETAGIAPTFPRRPRRQPQHQQQQPQHDAYMQQMQPQPAHQWQDVGRAQPWQDFAQQLGGQLGGQLGHWAEEAAQWMPHPAAHAAPPVGPPPQHPVTYAPYPMPHEVPAAHEAAAAHGPTFWSDTARRLGLIKPGDRLITVQEAQHYLNTIGGGQHLSEDGALGDQTRGAIAAFQLGHHLPATGGIDAETSSALLYQAFVAATPQVVSPGF